MSRCGTPGEGGWEATGSPWRYDTERYARVAATRRRARCHGGLPTTDRCRMRFLLDQLDGPFIVRIAAAAASAPVGARHPRCPPAPSNGPAAPWRRPGRPSSPTSYGPRTWPSSASRSVVVSTPTRLPNPAAPGAFHRSGVGRCGVPQSMPLRLTPRCPSSSFVVRSRCWWNGKRLGPSVRPPSLRSRVARTLDWCTRTRPPGSVGRLPHIGAVVHDGPPRPPARTNSAQRLAQLWGTLRLEQGLVDALLGDFAARPVLLLDDVMDSG